MIATVPAPTKNARVDAIFADVLEALCRVIEKHHVTYDEYREAVNWLTVAGTQEHEIPLLFDVFMATAIDNENFAGHGGTECNCEGPFYVPGAPRLELPYVLRKREEDGETLRFSGTVRSLDGSPLAGALLDVWQANGNKEYSFVHPGVPEYNLRGQFPADGEGRFEFETVVPSPYTVPHTGATGQLLAALGWVPWRPAHVHFKITHPDAQMLTTQIYFEGDPWIDEDVVGAVKAPLIIALERREDDRGQYAACSFDFVLPHAR
jgi:catechol 1,2-dioxygenase